MGDRSRSSYSVNLALTGLSPPSFSAHHRGVEMYTFRHLRERPPEPKPVATADAPAAVQRRNRDAETDSTTSSLREVSDTAAFCPAGAMFDLGRVSTIARYGIAEDWSVGSAMGDRQPGAGQRLRLHPVERGRQVVVAADAPIEDLFRYESEFNRFTGLYPQAGCLYE